MKLIDLVKQRRQLAEQFTKPYQDRVEKELRDYRADPPNILNALNIDLLESVNSRYQFSIPLIFTNHESMMASMFDRAPEILFLQRGQQDDYKEKVVKASYEYLKDALDLEMFMTDAAWWYLLTGFVSAHVGYAQDAVNRPALDEETGEPILDETGAPVTYADFTEDDPFVSVGNPKREVFSPESEPSIDGSGMPYYVLTKLMTVEEVKRIYGKKVEPDATIEIDQDFKPSEEAKADLERVKVYFYYGVLPESVKGEVRGWKADGEYVVVFTEKEMLAKSALNQKQCRTLKWHGAPNEFFGFGIAKLLAPFQKEKSMRRGQLARYADIAAYPKLLIDQTAKIDNPTIRDPRENLTILYNTTGNKPEYLSAPNINAVVMDANNLADQDAQAAAGLLDLSQGSQQSSTVDTATGQTIFADAAEKRMRLAKKKFLYFYKEIVILALKMCQQNWATDKVVSITDEDGNSEEVVLNRDSFADIDFDRDIDIDFESTSINKDVLREQAIALYDKTKDDPRVERTEILKDALREGFMRKNPEKYIKPAGLEPNTQLVNPATGEQFIVDETGEVVPAQNMMETANPSGDPVGKSQAGLMGAVQ